MNGLTQMKGEICCRYFLSGKFEYSGISPENGEKSKKAVDNEGKFFILKTAMNERVWHNGCAPAFQAGYGGSTPPTRSTYLKGCPDGQPFLVLFGEFFVVVAELIVGHLQFFCSQTLIAVALLVSFQH